jgi:N-acylneuraminate cytidylyltransferase
VPFIRSAENSTDLATTTDVIIEVLGNYKSNLKKEFKFLCCIYPAAPLIEPLDLITGYNLLCEENFQSLFPVVPFSYPVWRGLERSDTGKTKMLWAENVNKRTQDLKKVFHDAGQWYWLDASMAHEGVFTNNTGTIIVSELRFQDIDSIEDWKMAELKYKIRHEV